jgi:Terminase large subunit, ATPase domain
MAYTLQTQVLGTVTVEEMIAFAYGVLVLTAIVCLVFWIFLVTTTLARAKRKPVAQSETRAERNIRWVEEHCRLPEGKLVGQKFKMPAYMVEDFKLIYDNAVPTRRAIISRGRKNAKSFECACIALLHLCGPEQRRNSQLYSDAQSRDQAGLIFSLGAKMVSMDPDLRAVVIIRDTAKELYCPELGIKYKALSADASTAFGLNPALTIHDELGQVRGPRSTLYEALETATAAQEEPLSVIISTQAPTDADLLSILIDDALAGHDPRTVVSLYTAPQELDPFDRHTIKLANPALGSFLNEREVMAMANDAQRMPRATSIIAAGVGERARRVG